MILAIILFGMFLLFPFALIMMLVMSRQHAREKRIIHEAALKRAREDLGQ